MSSLRKSPVFVLVSALILIGCGGGGGSTSTTEVTNLTNDTTTESSNNTLSLSGKVTYDYVPGSANGLDYTNIQQKPVRYAVVELINADGRVIDSTHTDENGNYSFTNVEAETQVKVRIAAEMLQTSIPGWDIKVVDNTNSDALYVMEGKLASTGTTDQIRDLNAPSGWDGNEYSSERIAAPFAILDNMYATIQTILSADPQTLFPPLQVNWSVNNVAIWGNPDQGEIGTSHYIGGNLFILGDADSDTDEYDNHVITHEWGHYYEDMFSRSDSIGGSHSGGEILDIRVAFGEGWGNAFSAISLQDPIYFDTYGSQQQNGWSMNIEDDTHNNPGWFSESSIQRIIYDLWDNNDDTDNNDTVTLGFSPIHTVMINEENTTKAFTSLFTFITAMKETNSNISEEIDDIVSSEDIAPINDIYGTNRTNKSSQYPYYDIAVDGTTKVATSNSDGSYNKLSNRQYVKFTIDSAGDYTIKVDQTNDTNSDPDFTLYRASPHQYIKTAQSADAGTEKMDISLESGDYLIDIYDYNNVKDAQYDVSLLQN